MKQLGELYAEWDLLLMAEKRANLAIAEAKKARDLAREKRQLVAVEIRSRAAAGETEQVA